MRLPARGPVAMPYGPRIQPIGLQGVPVQGVEYYAYDGMSAWMLRPPIGLSVLLQIEAKGS